MSIRDELENELRDYLTGYLEGAESDLPADLLAESLADWLHDEGWRKTADIRTEWGVRRPPRFNSTVVWMTSRSEAESLAMSWDNGSKVVSRTVYVSPWTEATDVDR